MKPGDCVAIYMPMIPEAAIAMLGCARIGAVHSVVFGGFSAIALADRIADCKAKVLITADGKVVPLKETADAALKNCPTIEKTVVVKRTKEDVAWTEGRDLWWHELEDKAEKECIAVPFDSEHPLYILYTSGTTGKPKGVLHTSAGYLLQATWSTKLVFDLKEDDVYWCTADVGWVTGHTYVIYGPLSNGASVVMYEGAPDFPQKDRFWEIIDRYKATIFYSSATAVRAFMAWGNDWITPHSLESLRLLGTVGEPINPAAWKWYYEVIGKKSLPHRGHLVADRNRLDSDFSAARRDAHETRLGHAAASRRRSQSCEPERRTGRPRRNRIPHHSKTVALDDAHDLRRRCSLRRRLTGRKFLASISLVTPRSATKTVTSGSLAASMTLSKSPATA